MAETKDEYEKMISQRDEMDNELSAPRCANCYQNTDGFCQIFLEQIPDDYLYAYTECKEWCAEIPF